jgi:zinc-ribbon domain
MSSETSTDQGLPVWQFFLLCGMLGATAVVIVATGQSLDIIVLSLTIVAASFVGLGAYRTLSPLTAQSIVGAPTVAGGRTRAALEREKTLVLRAIKELEFDFAMRKMSQADFDEMSGRLRRRAIGLIQQLDADSGYREQIERELAALVATTTPIPSAQDPSPRAHDPRPKTQDPGPTTLACSACGTHNDADARFCKQCGTSLTS